MGVGGPTGAVHESVHLHSFCVAPPVERAGEAHSSPAPGGFRSVDAITCVCDRGIREDRTYDSKGRFRGQVSFFSWDVYVALLRDMNLTCLVSAMRRHIITEGLDLNRLVGREFEIQGIRFFGTEPCAVGEWMDEEFGAGAVEFLEGRSGVWGRILSDGRMRLGLSELRVFHRQEAHESG